MHHEMFVRQRLQNVWQKNFNHLNFPLAPSKNVEGGNLYEKMNE